MTQEFRDKVMSVIQKQKVAMRPRWHFILLSALIATGTLLLIVALLYIVSLIFFFMKESGVWYAPVFGGRGWFALLHSAPILLIGLVALCAVFLEILVRKYSFAYRAPLLLSLGGIICLVFVGGFAIAQTSLHHRLEAEAHHGRLPPPMRMFYDKAFRGPPPGDVFRGVIVSKGVGNFVFASIVGDATTTVFFTKKTRLPYGEDFEVGDYVVVIGDVAGTGTIRAFGVRPIDQ